MRKLWIIAVGVCLTLGGTIVVFGASAADALADITEPQTFAAIQGATPVAASEPLPTAILIGLVIMGFVAIAVKVTRD